MPRIKKKGTSGQAKNFITRTQAVRKLQISLPDFRRLCIFKGIYPREPRNKKKAAKSATPSTTFYYTKDIQYLLHEPLLQKFREHKILAKKIAKALGRGEASDAARLERLHKPRLTLDHIIKERYPTFVDALRDVDDALSMLFLFASLPSTSTIPPKKIALCQRLCHEFQHYLIITHSITKSFLSIKGIYYQATIQGQDILWVVPYKFVQKVGSDIDFRIMGTFIEFYTTLVGFINYRLYTSIGLVYPPKLDRARDEQGAELGAFTLEGRDITNPEEQVHATIATSTVDSIEATAKAQAAADALEASVSQEPTTAVTENVDEGEGEEVIAIDKFAPIAADSDTLPQPSASRNEAAALFARFTFYLSRETPRAPLEFLLKAFGCKRVGWDGVLGEGAFTHDEKSPAITHQVVDRPPQPVDAGGVPNGDLASANGTSSQGIGRVPGRTYVQPQWVWDCINQGKLLRPDLYAPGATLPPHLSPWIKPRRGEYDPTAPLDDDYRSTVGEIPKEKDIVNGIDSIKQIGDLEDGESANEEEADENEDDALAADTALAAAAAAKANVGTEKPFDNEDEDGFSGFESGEQDEDEEDEDEDEDDEDEDDDMGDDDDDEAAAHQRELEAEAAGRVAPPRKKAANGASAQQKAQQKRKQQEDEELERQKMMLPRRKRKLLEKMIYSNSKRDEEKEKLVAKRRKLGASAAAART